MNTKKAKKIVLVLACLQMILTGIILLRCGKYPIINFDDSLLFDEIIFIAFLVNLLALVVVFERYCNEAENVNVENKEEKS